MPTNELNDRILERGRDFFAAIADQKPSVFNRERWTGKVMDWCMRNEDFKVRMFRFIDVFPSLKSGDSLQRHLQEYFGDLEDLPEFLRWGLRTTGMSGRLGGAVLRRFLRRNIRQMGHQFIVGETRGQAARNLSRLRRDGFAFTVDALGEATVSEDEAESYIDTYLELLAQLGEAQHKWSALGNAREATSRDWGHAPMVNVSVKPSALYSQTRPQAFDQSVAAITRQMARIYRRVLAAGGFLCIDMESSRVKDITLEVYRRLREDFPENPHLGIVLQAYLKDTERDLDELLAWAWARNLPISVRLVKGAYWDVETVLAAQNGWEPPVFTDKAQTDATFERLARTILENHEICHLAVGSHNIRSIAAALETARELEVPEDRYEFQVLYGMAEPVRQALREVAGRVRLYCPYGEMVPGMAYLVRRLLENTANESFLRQSFAEGEEVERLLADPQVLLPPPPQERRPPWPTADPAAPFRNQPAADFTQSAQREAFAAALQEVRSQLGRDYPLWINGEEVMTADRVASLNPAAPGEVVGRVSQTGTDEVEQAALAAAAAFPRWRDLAPEQRARHLLDAAAIARGRIFQLAAWQVVEIGKQWDQAHADVAEAIDFLEYYARAMVRLGRPQRLPGMAGEVNRLFYQPRGVAAVIAPWNFPLAISTGMVAAALVTGNTVIYKPSNLTPVIGHGLAGILGEAGLPPGAFNYLPGKSSVMGDSLVEHPAVSLIAFTGSLEVGLDIVERASASTPAQEQTKRVIAEMGGKNAVIIDNDADLDEAVPAVLASAFGFQGQKCSACSRVIVLDEIYPAFIDRLVRGAGSLPIGPAENPAHAIGPVADKGAAEKIRRYIDIGCEEGELLYQSTIPEGEAFYVPLTIIAGITPAHRLAQEEIFGPVLAVMQVEDFDQALAWANSTPFALTGGVFSRSPKNLERARAEFRVGNLYLNRGITGALVGRQPFGGFKLSGLGTKAGGPDYLQHFMDPRCVTENTLRRGFAPPED